MRTTKVLSITLPDEMLKQAKRRAKRENRTMSELVREALRQYEREALQRYQAVQSLRELQAYGRKRASEQGITETDVNRLIKESRREHRAAHTPAPRRKAS